MNSEDFLKEHQEELKKWEELGVDPASMNPHDGMIGLIWRFETVVAIMVEKGIATQEEFDEKFREVCLSSLREMRESVVEPAVADARRQAIVDRGIIVPGMAIPKNKKRMN